MICQPNECRHLEKEWAMNLTAQSTNHQSSSHIINAQITINFAQQGVWRGSRFIPLPPRTFAILAYLARHPATIIAGEQLLAVGWPGEPRVPDDLTRHIRRIREAIEEQPERPQVLITRRGAGYCLGCQG